MSPGWGRTCAGCWQPGWKYTNNSILFILLKFFRLQNCVSQNRIKGRFQFLKSGYDVYMYKHKNPRYLNTPNHNRDTLVRVNTESFCDLTDLKLQIQRVIALFFLKDRQWQKCKLHIDVSIKQMAFFCYFERKGTAYNSFPAPLRLKLWTGISGEQGCRAQGSAEREYTTERVQVYLFMWDFRCNAYLMCGTETVKQPGKWKLLNSHQAAVQPSLALSKANVIRGDKHLNMQYIHTDHHVVYAQRDMQR